MPGLVQAIVAALLLAAGLASAGSATAAGRLALVIGNAAYKETAPLANPRNDAKDLASALGRLGFEVLEGLDLDKRSMERLVRDFGRRLAGTEVALFFYAGHGLQVGGQNYLVPTDARLAGEGDVDFETLPLRLILRQMEREARTSLVLLDACRDNPLSRNLARSMGTRQASVGQGLAEVKTGVGTLIGFSTQPGNVALDGEARNSPYTAALLRHIETPARDLLSTLAAVRGEVLKATDGRQVPWEHTSLLGPVVLKPAAGAPATPAAAARPTRPPQPDARSREAADYWAKVSGSTSVRELEVFATRYAGTFHGDLARARIEDLKAIAARGPPGTPDRRPSPTPPPAPASRHCATSPTGERYCASSVLAPQFGNSYAPDHLFDGDPLTAWVHGTGSPGVGAWISVAFDRPKAVTRISIVNGYAKNADIFAKNSRVRAMELIFSSGERRTLSGIGNDPRLQQHPITPPVAEASWVQLRIVEVFRGSRYADTAISELRFD